MPLDREKTFASAERLLKQGKAREAMEECRRLAEDAPKDLLMLNRVGDLLARSGRGTEAIIFYQKIADQFSASGFYPKAIAILKKIVKVDPGRTDALVHLGDLNIKQKLPGEARAWFLHAADAYLRSREVVKAREVYEKLVGVEPDNLVHAVRLAEARAAEGDAERAGRDLLSLGGRMLAKGRSEDADRVFKRAAELLPGRPEGFLGLARVHAAAGRAQEAIRLADEAWKASTGSEPVVGDLLLLFEQHGESGRAAALLADPRSNSIPDDAIEEAFRAAVPRGDVEGLWTRVAPLLDRWARANDRDRAVQVLDRIARVENGVQVRAMTKIVEIRVAEGNVTQAARAIERLVRVHQARGEQKEAAALVERLKTLDPASPLVLTGRPAAPPKQAPPPRAPAAARDPDEAVATAFEAPAVPLQPADEEFVSGHLTEAEVFEKYGLHNEALAQLREVSQRFPGHVVAQEKLVGFLRTQADVGELRDGLVALAFARRAAGDPDGGRRAAAEALQIGGIEAAPREALERLELLVEAPAEAPAPAPPRPAPKPAPAPPPAAKAVPPAPPPPAPPLEPVSRADEEELEILFDDSDAASGDRADEPAYAEIEFYIEQGMRQDAIARITAMRRSGASGPELDALEERARAAAPAARKGAAALSRDADAVVATGPEEGAGSDKLDEDDLSSIAAALEAEYGASPIAPTRRAAETEGEQSVDEVFAAFKEHIRSEVGGEDFRTHYDLGIAYKEMGLIEDALAEFRVATGAPELYREACSMLGIIHWERGEADEAIRWYRAALDAPGEEETPLSGLRYDLAEILNSIGDAQGAYDLFSQVLAVEPNYRDVQSRVADLRTRLRL